MLSFPELEPFPKSQYYFSEDALVGLTRRVPALAPSWLLVAL